MKKNNQFALYALDKKICSMIVDIEKLNGNIGEESANLFNTIEEQNEKKIMKDEFEEVCKAGISLISFLFQFKHALNQYQAKRSQTQMNEINRFFGKTKEEIEAIKEQEQIQNAFKKDFESENIEIVFNSNHLKEESI